MKFEQLGLNVIHTVIDLWTSVNGEGIYGTRPWRIFGEVSPESKAFKPGRFNENYKFNSKDIRFTTKDGILYAFCPGIPTEDILFRSLSKNLNFSVRPVASVKMLGSDTKIRWTQTTEGLKIKKPSKFPLWQVPGFKIEFNK